jgi:tRNA-splicing ligase RtcB (3'-phosphate/5'-hydroxy nucleic acid ligase)
MSTPATVETSDIAGSALAAGIVRSGPYTADIPASFRADMRVPARIFADDELLRQILVGEAVTQLVNVTTLPGIVDFAYGMPDMHEGYGFPVGGVAATLLPDGVISPGGVGFDINCGVRLLATPLTRAVLGERYTALTHEISRSIPAGTGRGGQWALTDAELDRVLTEGATFVVRTKAFGVEEDLMHTESGGRLDEADYDAVSARARERGRTQLGTLGAGNHFVELQYVEEIFDAAAAKAFGLAAGQVTVLIHTGSRGLGHQVCTDYVRVFDANLEEHGIVLPDRQLSCAPASSTEGRAYFAAMSAAANFAFANRQTIAHRIREAIHRMFPDIGLEDVRVVYDVAHNIAKRETHAGRSLCVHRKGATRAFGPGHEELPADYRKVGQPVFIPGSMGTASFVLVGTRESAERSFASACHGAGRMMSRGAAKRAITGAALRAELESRGIAVRCPSSSGLAEEAPLAYKDVERVTEVVERAGLARRVARLRPIGVVKG